MWFLFFQILDIAKLIHFITEFCVVKAFAKSNFKPLYNLILNVLIKLWFVYLPEKLFLICVVVQREMSIFKINRNSTSTSVDIKC